MPRGGIHGNKPKRAALILQATRHMLADVEARRFRRLGANFVSLNCVVRGRVCPHRRGKPRRREGVTRLSSSSSKAYPGYPGPVVVLAGQVQLLQSAGVKGEREEWREENVTFQYLLVCLPRRRGAHIQGACLFPCVAHVYGESAE